MTLITGDRIAVDGKGNPVSVQQGKGRGQIPIAISRSAGHTYAIPLDAQRLVREAKVDRRLFDLTLLSRAEYRKANASGLQLIVDYESGGSKGAEPASRREVRTAGNTTIRHTYTRLNAQAVTADRRDPAKVWHTLTDSGQNGAVRSMAAGLSKVWLDSIYKANLDKSVPQIGAPTAWKAGYNGTGTKIAVLDTGVDQSHPDLATREIAEKNFSDSPDNKDRFGHGTHVASIAAGTGAKSGGTYTGVAPGAMLLDGKVLNDWGSGPTSDILAGMEWAAAEGADVVNLSLGSRDKPGIDPLEEAVNRLSEQTGTLFVVSAGNSGPHGIGSPGSADAALTVGAVDKQDRLADFSSTGPRTGDSAIKPDLTAPGVDIGAAAAAGTSLGTPVADGYVALSGTSMAAPHVAGSAALLKQQHPDWTGQRIKAALTASAAPAKDYTPFQQGSGRVDAAKAIEQTVIAEQVSLSFGVQQWPHHDDKRVTKDLTYRNLGPTPVSLDVSVAATGPDGKPAPQGMFTLGQQRVTVPAGGTAQVPVTVNTRLGGPNNGAYSAYLVARGDGQSVRTAAAVDREVESYDIIIRHLGRDGKPAQTFFAYFLGIDGPSKARYMYVPDDRPSVTMRLPKGSWAFSSFVHAGTGNQWQGGDWIGAPKFKVTKDATVTVDARTAKPVDITVPDATARQYSAFAGYEIKGTSLGAGVWVPSFEKVGTAHLGPKATRGELHQQFLANWMGGTEGAEYSVGYGSEPTALATGYTKHVQRTELARIMIGMGASVPGRTGFLIPRPHVGGSMSAVGVVPRELPRTTTLYVNTAAAAWELHYVQQTEAEDSDEVSYFSGPTAYQSGRSYRETFNVGVIGPKVDEQSGLFRDGNAIYGNLPVFADGRGHHGASYYDKATTTLYRNGQQVGTNHDPLTGKKPFTVPTGKARYKLTTTVSRSQPAAVTTTLTSTWTFHSARTAEPTRLPTSVVRYTPDLALDSTAKANATARIPVTVQGSAADRSLKSLTVYVSYDGGKTWKKAAVSNGKITVKNPEAGKGISFKAKVTDRQGNTLSQTIHNAYLGK